MIYTSILGTDGKPSSKKITAYISAYLICTVVIFKILMDACVVIFSIELTVNQLRLFDLTDNALLVLVGHNLALNGIAGWQQVSNNKILNPPPPEHKTVVQTGSPAITVEENKPNEP